MDDLGVLLARLSDSDTDTALRAQALLAEICRKDKDSRDQVVSALSELTANARTLALRALVNVLPGESELMRLASEAAQSEHDELARAGLAALRNVTVSETGAREVVLSRLGAESDDVVAEAIESLRPAAHLPSVREAIAPISGQHPRDRIRGAAIDALFNASVLERLTTDAPSEQLGQAVHVIADPGLRAEALSTIEDARDAACSLAEFAINDEQRAAVTQIVDDEILPALLRLEGLLTTEAVGAPELESMREEARTLAGRTGGMLRGVSKGVGNNAGKVLHAWHLGEKIWALVEKIPV